MRAVLRTTFKCVLAAVAAFLPVACSTGEAIADSAIVTVDGVTYSLDTVRGSFNDNIADIFSGTPWWGQPLEAKKFSEAYVAAGYTSTLADRPASAWDFYAYAIDEAYAYVFVTVVGSGRLLTDGPYRHSRDAGGTFWVTATELPTPPVPVPEIDGATMAKLTLVLGTLWLVFGVGRRDEGEAPRA